jgi:transcriptional regulator with XRE-family HTH domain
VKGDPRVLFGRRLRELRKDRGWSQEQLAFESDLDRTYIGGIEQGRRNVSLVNICRLAKALRVKPEALFQFKKT